MQKGEGLRQKFSLVLLLSFFSSCLYSYQYLNQGLVEEKSGNLAEAEILYSKAIEVDSENEQAFFNRGNVRRLMHQYERALSDFTTAIGLNPEYSSAYFSRALVKETLNDMYGAM